MYEYLLQRHATTFMSQLLGLPKQDFVAIRRPSDDCREAIESYNDGKMRKAARKATSAINNDKTRRYNGYFVKGLAMAKDGDLDTAHEMFLMAIRYGREDKVSPRDFERGLLVIDQLRENGGQGWVNATTQPASLFKHLGKETETHLARLVKEKLQNDNASAEEKQKAAEAILKEALRLYEQRNKK